MTRFFTAPFLPFMLLAPLVTPVPVQAAAEPLELVRAGDSAMTCTALASEINSLAAADAPVATDQPAKPKKHFGGLLKVLGGAAPFVPGIGSVRMLVASGATTAASLGAEKAPHAAAETADALVRRAMAGPSIAQQRRDRLSTMFSDKHC